MTERLHFFRADGSAVEVAWTSPREGDFHIDGDAAALAERRSQVMAGDWAVVRQVHGSNVVDASTVIAADVVPEADGIVTSALGQPISVQGADCAPIVFITNSGPIGVAHAGWRGLADGVIAAVDEEIRSDGSRVERAVIGPVICAACYEFGSEDLDHVASRLGDSVRSATAAGTPALDLRAGITAAFDKIDVTSVEFVGGCPSCDHTGFSHRARSDPQRHCVVAQLVDGEKALVANQGQR